MAKVSCLLIQKYIHTCNCVNNAFADLPPKSLKLHLEDRFWNCYGSKISSLDGKYILQENLINGFPNWKHKNGIKALWYHKKKWVIGSSGKVGSNTFDVCLPTYEDNIFSDERIWPHLIFNEWKYRGNWREFRKWHYIGTREFHIENGKVFTMTNLLNPLGSCVFLILLITDTPWPKMKLFLRHKSKHSLTFPLQIYSLQTNNNEDFGYWIDIEDSTKRNFIKWDNPDDKNPYWGRWKITSYNESTGKFYEIFGPYGIDSQPHNVNRKPWRKWQINVKSSSQAKTSFLLESFSVCFENLNTFGL